MKPSLGIFSFGTSFSGKSNEKAMKMFTEKKAPSTLGELTDYTTLDEYSVTVIGDSPPPPINDWSSLSEEMKSALSTLGFTKPTPIQKYSIPMYRSKRPFIGVSPTGSGKTLAYALPLLEILSTLKENTLRAVVLVPTRELASQVHRQFKRISTVTDTKVQLLRKNRDFPKCQLVIATPKRLLQFSQHLDKVEYLVIDEADHLLSYSFVSQTDQVLSKLPKTGVHVTLYSATMNSKVEEAARSFMPNAIKIQIGDHSSVASQIQQELKFVGNEKGKVLEIRQRLAQGDIELPAIIFVMNKQRAKDLAGEVGVPCAVLTSSESDSERAEAIRKIRTGAAQFLIATDLGARGIDLPAIQTVINFDLPVDSTTYIHRIGRTARAGRAGKAITFFTVEDQPNLRPVATVMKKNGYEVEEWMLSNPDKNRRGARALFEPVERKSISTKIWNTNKVRVPKSDPKPL